MSSSFEISVIIPTYNEESRIVDLLHYLKENSDPAKVEILVVDGQSTDQTVKKIADSGFRYIISPRKGRAEQMNLGAKHTTGEILYFVHADSLPPETFASDIQKVLQKGYDSGSYRFAFDSDKWLLKINSWFTRFDVLMFRGGDQTLFVRRKTFNELDGFKNYDIMEDFDFIRRLRKQAKFTVLQKDTLISARKYQDNSYFKVNLVNLAIFIMFFLGVSQKKMVNTYKKLIQYTKFGNSDS